MLSLHEPKENNLDALIDLAIKTQGNTERDCTGLILNANGNEYKPYSVSITHRDLLFFCDNATLNYLVDTYGDRNTIELLNIELD